MQIRYLFKKILAIFSIFNWRKYKKQTILEQVKTYNESNLALLLNTYAFIESSKKAPHEEIEQYADSLDEALTEIFKPLCNPKEN